MVEVGLDHLTFKRLGAVSAFRTNQNYILSLFFDARNRKSQENKPIIPREQTRNAKGIHWEQTGKLVVKKQN